VNRRTGINRVNQMVVSVYEMLMLECLIERNGQIKARIKKKVLEKKSENYS